MTEKGVRENKAVKDMVLCCLLVYQSEYMMQCEICLAICLGTLSYTAIACAT